MKTFNDIKLNYLKHKFSINLGLLVFLFLLSHFWQGFIYAAFIFLAIICLIDKLENGFSYVIFCVPYITVFPPISTILYFIAILAYIVKLNIILFFTDKCKFKIWALVLIAILLIYCVLPFGPYNRNLFVKICMILFLIVLINVFCQKSKIMRVDYNIRIVSISLIIACCMSLLRYALPWFSESFRYIHRFKALFDNTNTLAMVCEVLLGMLLYSIITNKKWQDFLFFAIVGIIGLLTFSKTYYLILALLLLIMFFVFVKSKPKTTITAVVLGVIGVGLVYLIVPQTLNFFVSRFVGGIDNCSTFADFMNMVTTGRYTLWIDYLTYLFENPLKLIFGCGLGSGRISYSSSHNTFIALLFQLGIVGSALFIAVIVSIIKQKPKTEKVKFNKAIIIPFVVLFLICFVEDTIFFISRL